MELHKIPMDIGWYLTGFADGEGSFNVSFRQRNDYKIPWKISLCFNVSQKDPVVLFLYKKYLGCGTMRQRKDGVWYYEVNNYSQIVSKVIPFFQTFSFRSAYKKKNFSKFLKIANLIKENKHLSYDGIKEILSIRSDMNDGGKRKFSDEVILNTLKNPQRLHAEFPKGK